MSRRRKHETEAHRKERNRKRLDAAEKRHEMSKERRRRATLLYRAMESLSGRVRVIWHHIPRSWRRRLEKGRSL